MFAVFMAGLALLRQSLEPLPGSLRLLNGVLSFLNVGMLWWLGAPFIAALPALFTLGRRAYFKVQVLRERQRLRSLLEVTSRDRTLELLEFLEYTLSISTRPGSKVLRRLQRVHYSPDPSGRALLWALGDRLETLQLAEAALGKLEERTQFERKVLSQ